MKEKPLENTEIQNIDIIETLILSQSKAKSYIEQFVSDNKSIQLNFELKRDHIERVANYSSQIAESLNWDDLTKQLAITAAWLHDIGRFKQLTDSLTFNDTEESNHATIGVQVISELNLLSELPLEHAEAVNFAVLNHNKLLVPKSEKPLATELCKIIRDADKLDIIDLTIKEFSNNTKKKNSLFSLELKDSPAISPEVAKGLELKKMVLRSELRTLTDFKLMVMQFVLDLNYKKSYLILTQKQMMRQLFEILPKSDVVFEAYRDIKIQIENNIR